MGARKDQRKYHITPVYNLHNVSSCDDYNNNGVFSNVSNISHIGISIVSVIAVVSCSVVFS